MSIISIHNLGIRYTVYKSRSGSLSHRILQSVSRELARREFWALRQVTFDVNEGETLGVIGRNGAGKSTLCMAAAQILSPDEGNVTVRGRVAPILSLRSGYNKDLTGRENIYLCGALMGYKPSEIKAREQSILSFAGLGEFIDNPVRNYSSGMRTRLAFSVATSIDPDVLVLDEVLGVGDASFRKKSEARMRELMEKARAIILVSHSTDTIRNLCNRALWLDKGRVKAFGAVEEVVEKYEEWQESRAAGKKRASGEP